MKKDEILKKNRIDNTPLDEREKAINSTAFTFGALGMGCIFLLLFAFNLWLKNRNSYDLFAMYFGFCAVSYIYKSYVSKQTKNIFSAIIFSIITSGFIFLYITRG